MGRNHTNISMDSIARSIVPENGGGEKVPHHGTEKKEALPSMDLSDSQGSAASPSVSLKDEMEMSGSGNGRGLGNGRGNGSLLEEEEEEATAEDCIFSQYYFGAAHAGNEETNDD